MNIKSLMTASIFAFASASVAQAADVMIPQEMPPVIVAPTFSWTGLYVGGQLGGFSGKGDLSAVDKGAELVFPGDVKLSGFVGGLYAGSNIDFGSGLVLGVDTDIVWANKESTLTSKTRDLSEDDAKAFVELFKEHNIELAPGTIKEVSETLAFKEKWSGATRVRIGFAADRIMPYITGGLAYTQVQAVGSVSLKGEKTPAGGGGESGGNGGGGESGGNGGGGESGGNGGGGESGGNGGGESGGNGGGGESGGNGGGGESGGASRSGFARDAAAMEVLGEGVITNDKKTMLGYTLGAGVDFAMTDNIILRTEYRYSDFGKKKFVKDGIEVSYKTNDFRVGVAYKF
ncbi:outer membrane protein [Bartonella ancashensis]|uniref:Porin n=1 Tax=Bartonella ancashensis TaxID=1318743 RepID=A0A0M4L6T2_9HYPH|nr:porin [Bartonella ancashensis]ALE03458.1 Hemin binding protein c [Bartonella ancashensis]